ncbi:MAG: hypothetical protein DI626_02635, partial [Micavibrio aeruginosavorus]
MIPGAFDAFFLPFPVLVILIFAFGLCLGSFATAIVYRAPRGISWIGSRTGGTAAAERSLCPSCGHKLRARDLVPFLSWALAKGRCRYCASPVSPSYPLTEISVAVLVVLLFCVYGTAATSWPLYLAIPFLCAAGIIGINNEKLPEDIVYALSLLSAVYLLLFWNGQDRDIRVIGYAVLSVALLGALIAGALKIRAQRRGMAPDRGWLLFAVPAGVFTLGGDFP